MHSGYTNLHNPNSYLVYGQYNNEHGVEARIIIQINDGLNKKIKN